MNVKLSYWVSVVFGALSLILVVVNISLASSNRSMQSDLSQRASALTAGNSFNQLNQGLVQALAEAAVKNNDQQARELLSSQGITLKSEAENAAAAAAPGTGKTKHQGE